MTQRTIRCCGTSWIEITVDRENNRIELKTGPDTAILTREGLLGLCEWFCFAASQLRQRTKRSDDKESNNDR